MIGIGTIARFKEYSNLTEGMEPIFEPGQCVLIETVNEDNGEITYNVVPVDLFGERIDGKGDQLFDDEIDLLGSDSEIAPGFTTAGDIDPEVKAQHEAREYTLHEITNKFPEMSDAAYGELREDIKRHGQLVPIVALPDSQIIDGKHRYKACQELGIPPLAELYEGPQDEKPLFEYVRSLNARRRHLTADELKAFAVKRKKEGVTQKEIAEEVGVTQSAISKTLQKEKYSKEYSDNSSTKSKTSQNFSESGDAADNKETIPQKPNTPSEAHFELLTPTWRSSLERQWKASTKTAQKRFAAWVRKQVRK